MRLSILNKFLLYFHTLRYLKFIQIRYRVYYAFKNRFKKFFPTKERALPTGDFDLNLQPSLLANKSVQYNDLCFSFINLQKQFNNTIDWNYTGHGKLWTYNLNYFEFLHTKSFSKEDGLQLIHDFIKNIDTIKDGLEPYPISLRSIHWIKFLVLYKIKDKTIDFSLYQQLSQLVHNLEYHLLGNHLLENGFSLLWGAYYFSDSRFYQKAATILLKELNEQVLTDGGHFELSPMYHQLMLYRVLDSYNLVKNNPSFNKELLGFLKEKAQIMLGWLTQMTFSNGDIPLLNDSAFNINPTTKELVSYANQLEIIPKKRPLKESGYRKIIKGNYEIVVDIGHIGPNYIPGHAHGDIFNFVLYVKEQPFIVDTGISTYNTTKRRKIERSTSAHNTVQIGDAEQAEFWSSFRVARRSVPTIIKDENDKITAKLVYPTTNDTHTRQFNCQENEILIEDLTITKKISKAYLHFHPSISVTVNNNSIHTSLGKIQTVDALAISLTHYQYAPEFNVLKTASQVIITFRKTLKTIIIV